MYCRSLHGIGKRFRYHSRAILDVVNLFAVTDRTSQGRATYLKRKIMTILHMNWDLYSLSRLFELFENVVAPCTVIASSKESLPFCEISFVRVVNAF